MYKSHQFFGSILLTVFREIIESILNAISLQSCLCTFLTFYASILTRWPIMIENFDKTFSKVETVLLEVLPLACNLPPNFSNTKIKLKTG